jgi:hypothetical protein
MFVLSKRSRSNEAGEIFHVIYGITGFADAARCWYRATRTTDVIEIPDEVLTVVGEFWETGTHIQDHKFPSWREQQAAAEKALRMGAK